MRKFLVLLVLLAGCQTTPDAQTLPTLAVLPSLTPADTEEATATTEPTEPASTAAPTHTLTLSPTSTTTVTSTNTPLPTNTPAPNVTVVSTTSGVPRIATLTPVPAGQNAPLNSTPQVLADLTITELEFQAELDNQLQLIDSATIEDARIDFVENGISVELTALGGSAFITGSVFLSLELSGSFIAISPIDIAVNAPEPPPVFVETVNGDFLNLILQTLDALLTQRLGPEHNLQRLVITPAQMEINLLVPQR